MITTLYLIEGKRYNIGYICELLGSNWAEVVTSLSDILEEINGGYLTFRFVGFIFWENRLVIILPKYYHKETDDDRVEHSKLLLQTLLKCQRQRFGYLNLIGTHTSDFDEDMSEAGAALYLMEDFLSQGYWNRQETTIDNTGDGEIIWDKTIDNHLAYRSGRSVVYLDFDRKNSYSTGDVITSFHQWAITVLWEKYGELLGFSYPLGESEFSYGDAVLSARASDYFDVEYLKHIIILELHRSFIDRNIRLLKYLLYLLTNEGEDFYDTKQIALYGTKDFHVIWEIMCGFMFKNQYEYYKKFIPRPVWVDSQGRRSTESYTLRPDILVYNANTSQFLILDAKYYNLYFDYTSGVKVKGSVGTYDIVKQKFYELILKENRSLHIAVQNIEGADKVISRFRNFFLIPSIDCDGYQYYGNVSLSDFQIASSINLFRINPSNLMLRFLNNNSFSSGEMTTFISLAQV